MRVYAIKYKKDLNIPPKPPVSVNDFTKGPFIRAVDEYEPFLYRTKSEAKKEAENLSIEKEFDLTSCEVVSLYIDEADAIFHLYNIAFSVFPEFRKCAIEPPKDLL